MPYSEQLKNESLLQYYFRSIGPADTLMLFILAGVAFVLVAVIVMKGKGPTVGPALVLTAPMAAYYGLYSTFDGFMAVCRVIEQSGTTPDPVSLVSGFVTSIASFYIGMLLSMPAFLLAVIGAATRALSRQDPH